MQKNRILKSLVVCSIYLLFAGYTASNQEPIKVESIDAKNVSSDESGNLHLSGNVFIKTNYLEFWSEKATFNVDDQSFELQGKVKVLSKNLSLDTNKLKANLSNQTFSLSKTTYTLLGRTFGQAEEFKVLTSGNVELLNTSFNNCSKEDPFWEVSASKIILLNNEKNIVIRDLKLKLGEVPVFYLPYLRTAIGQERLSGFLTPSIRQGKDGLDLSIPYYFNIAPNHDLTFAPRYIEERGTGLAISYRYLSKLNKGKILISGLSKDRKYNQETLKESSRWRGSWTQISNINDRLFSEIRYEDASDKLYFRDINDDLIGNAKKDYLQRNVDIEWGNPNIKLGLSLKQSQTLNPFSFDDYKSVPVINFGAFTTKNNLSFLFSSNFGVFELEENSVLLQKNQKIKRSFFQPEVRYKRNFNSSDFIISVGSDETIYRFNDNKIKRSTPWLEAEYKVYLEKHNNEFYNLLTPVIKYINIKDNSPLHNPLIDTRLRTQSFQNLYKRNWFSGKDKISDRNRIIVGLEHLTSSNLSSYNNYFSLGRAFLEEASESSNPTSVNSKSALVGEFKSFLNEKTWFSGMLEWDSTSDQINTGFINLSHKSDTGFSLDLRSSFRRNNLLTNLVPWVDINKPMNHIEFSSQWPMLKNFTVFTKLKKDLESSTSIDILYGFQYSNCCLKAGLMKRKWQEQDFLAWQNNYPDPYTALSNGYNPIKERDNIYIFFEFKQMGRLGKQISEVISSTLQE